MSTRQPAVDIRTPHPLWRLECSAVAELEESLLWKLEQLGCRHLASQRTPATHQRVTVLGWLSQECWSREAVLALVTPLAGLAAAFDSPPPRFHLGEEPPDDWSRSWKRHWQPDPVGRTLLVLPAWLDCPAEQSHRRVLRLDPGSAFGTGSHPTTRLCMEALEQQPLEGTTVVDLGSGSGILSITALMLGAAYVVACDTDPLAVAATRNNAALNGLTTSQLQVIKGSSPELMALDQPPADLLLCNILAPVLAELAPSFRRLLAFHGCGWLSGLLMSQVPTLQQQLEGCGWTVECSAQQQGWALLSISWTR